MQGISLRRLLLLDAIGAGMSALGALVVLVLANAWLGIHPGWLIITMLFAAGMVSYDLICLRFDRAQYAHCLAWTAAGNTLFVIAASCVLSVDMDQMTAYGVVYMALEVGVVGLLVLVQIFAIWKQRLSRSIGKS